MSYSHDSQFAADVDAELARTRQKHPQPIHSTHEGYAVLLEEVTELQAEVFKSRRDVAATYAELVQVAAMARRMAEDLGLAESAIARRLAAPAR